MNAAPIERSISDDDLCSTCTHCAYNPGETSRCHLAWPGKSDANGYVVACDKFTQIEVQG